jgi:hypothetical protein
MLRITQPQHTPSTKRHSRIISTPASGETVLVSVVSRWDDEMVMLARVATVGREEWATGVQAYRLFNFARAIGP